MALLASQQINVAGLQATYSAVNTNDTVTPDDDIILHVKNGAGSSINVTITDGGTTPAGNAATNRVVAVPNAQDRFIYLPAGLAGSNPTINVNYSSTTTITAALLRM